MRYRIGSFARASSLLAEHRKICFVDEAEYLSKQAQGALRKVIEDTSSTCRFIFAVNDMPKIIPALRSRLIGVCFDLVSSDWVEVKDKLISRYTVALSKARIKFDRRRLAELIGIYYPDLRSIANQVQYEFVYGDQAA